MKYYLTSPKFKDCEGKNSAVETPPYRNALYQQDLHKYLGSN